MNFSRKVLSPPMMKNSERFAMMNPANNPIVPTEDPIAISSTIMILQIKTKTRSIIENRIPWRKYLDKIEISVGCSASSISLQITHYLSLPDINDLSSSFVSPAHFQA
jgi:hypothetical protein